MIHGVIGAASGAFVLHPLSMLIHGVYQTPQESVLVLIERSVSFGHIYMTLFFITLGLLGGIIHGSDAYRLSLLYERVKRLSMTDDLTGLPNRRQFIGSLNASLYKTGNREAPISLLLIDMDRFKDFNDSLGHPEGDSLLREFGRRITDLVRGTDLVARYGGEEFAVLMPSTSKHTATRTAERLRRWAEDGMDGEWGGRFPTLSIGVASSPDDGWNPSTLIRAADSALYRAKRAGRNKVCVHPPGSETGPAG